MNKQELFESRVDGLEGDNYMVLGVYINARTNIKMRHAECGNEWQVNPDNFINKNTRCPSCAFKRNSGNRTMKHKDFVEQVDELTGTEYKVLSRYKKTHKEIKIKHVTCGHVYVTRPSGFLRGSRCPECANVQIGMKLRLTHTEYLERIKENHGNEFEVIGTYIKSDEKIEIKHIACGKSWVVFPLNITGCPNCYASEGESLVESYLIKNQYKYMREYRFSDCRHKNTLPFDFAIFKNGELINLIEFEGRQHYVPIDYWGGIENLKKTQLRDEIKRDYCSKNNIPLIEIPYWRMTDINKILLEGLQ